METYPNNTRIGKAQWMVLLAAFGGWLFDGYEMGLFPLVARPSLTSMFDGAGSVDAFVGMWMGNITALFLIGAATGGFLFGWLGDKIGRVKSMALSIFVYSIFTGMGFFAQEPWQLGGLRFIAALGMGGEWSLGVALVMECWPDRWRPWLAAAIGAASNFGYLLVAFTGKIVSVTPDSWRWIFLVGVFPALMVVLVMLFVPESERWKASVVKDSVSPVRLVFSRAYLRTTLLGIAFASVALIGTWGSVQWIPLWVDKLVGPAMPWAKAESAMATSLGAIIGSMIGPLLGGRFGRRPAFFFLCISSLLTCGFLFRAGLEYNFGFLLAAFLVGASTASFYGWFPLFLPELFPTRARATGQGICYNSGRIFAAAGALLGGQLVGWFDGDYARMGATITLVYLPGMVLIWLVHETRGKPLPD